MKFITMYYSSQPVEKREVETRQTMYSLSSGLSSLLLLLVLFVWLWLLEKDLGPCWDLDWTPSDIALLSFDTGIGRGRGKEETWRLEYYFWFSDKIFIFLTWLTRD